MSTQFSLYIPTLKVSYDANKVIYIFRKFNLGKVDRVDFVPIMNNVEGKTELEEDKRFKQAFIYIESYSYWHPDIISAIKEEKPYKFYPNNDSSYWLLLKNKKPVPFAITPLNIHQLAHNNELLETKVSDMEKEMLKMKEEIARLKEENNAMSCQMRADIERNWDRCHGFTEEEAESFVNSWENILKMSEETNTNEKYDEEYETQREREEDLVYDDSGEMTPRGRVIKTGL
jgi:hypothetical protein